MVTVHYYCNCKLYFSLMICWESSGGVRERREWGSMCCVEKEKTGGEQMLRIFYGLNKNSVV